MPKKKCIKNLSGCYMRPIKKEGEFIDIDHKQHKRYITYECDCGAEHQLDRLKNVWLC